MKLQIIFYINCILTFETVGLAKMWSGLRVFLKFETLLLPIYCIVLVKSYFPVRPNHSTLWKLSMFIVRPILSAFLFSCLILAMAFFIMVYEIVNIILKLKHGYSYCGLLSGNNALHKYDKNIINAIIATEADNPNDAQKLINFFHEIYPTIIKKHERMQCTIEEFMGYFYYKKRHIDLNDTIRTFNDYEDYESFKDKMQNIVMEPMSHGGKLSWTWTVLVGTKIIIWENGRSVLPVVLRYDHALGDGAALIALTMVNFFNDGVELIKESMDKLKVMLENRAKKQGNVQKNNRQYDFWHIIKTIKKYLTKEYFLLHDLDRDYVSVLHPGKLSGQKYVCWTLKKDGDDIKKKIKQIRNSFEEISYSDVILSACTASLRDYFNKNSNAPETITIWISFYLTSADFNKLVQIDENNIPSVNLENKFTMLAIKLPINKKDVSDDLHAILKYVNKQTNALKKSMDFYSNYWVTQILGTVLPKWILMFFLRNYCDATALISILPGNQPSSYKCGNNVADTVYFSTNYLETGVTMLLTSNNDDMRISCMVDKACVRNREDVQLISDDILKYIDIMAKEMC